MNVHAPYPISRNFLAAQDEYLREELAQKDVTASMDLKPITEEICLDQAQKLAQDMDGDLLLDDCTKFVSPGYGQ